MKNSIQEIFAKNAAEIIQNDRNVLGLAFGGSWLTNEMDAFSDLDLILVTADKIADDKAKMLAFAEGFGKLISAFTGEHVGEPRLLICLYDNPLLHVDIKFVTAEEFRQRDTDAFLLTDNTGRLKTILQTSEPVAFSVDFQWIEDRFWIWIHYALLKIARGEYLEALDFMGFLRMQVFGPLLHAVNKSKHHGVRRAETKFTNAELEKLTSTIPSYSKDSILQSLRRAVDLYKELRIRLFPSDIILHTDAEQSVMQYLRTFV